MITAVIFGVGCGLLFLCLCRSQPFHGVDGFHRFYGLPEFLRDFCGTERDYGRIRTIDGETIAETVADKGITMNTDDFHAWVFNTLRSN